MVEMRVMDEVIVDDAIVEEGCLGMGVVVLGILRWALWLGMGVMVPGGTASFSARRHEESWAL